MKHNLPHKVKPCDSCPFRKDTMQGWLGKGRMEEILNSGSFTCHKTKDTNRLQCAGHMLIKGNENDFVQLANRLRINLNLTGKELIFDTKEDCIKHHTI